MACWMVTFVQLYVSNTAEVWSGNKHRQKRDVSIDGGEGLS
jgi:hypothetical protein